MDKNKLNLLKNNKKQVKRYVDCLGYLSGMKISLKLTVLDRVLKESLYTSIIIFTIVYFGLIGVIIHSITMFVIGIIFAMILFSLFQFLNRIRYSYKSILDENRKYSSIETSKRFFFLSELYKSL